jgi:hypothetical protein
MTGLGNDPLRPVNRCDKNVIVPSSERITLDQNALQRVFGNIRSRWIVPAAKVRRLKCLAACGIDELKSYSRRELLIFTAREEALDWLATDSVDA